MFTLLALLVVASMTMALKQVTHNPVESDSSDSSSSTLSELSNVDKPHDFLHDRERDAPHCNAAHAAAKYTDPIQWFLTTDGDGGAALEQLHNIRYFKEEFLLNNKTISKPLIADVRNVKQRGFFSTAQFVTLTAKSASELSFFYKVRFASISNEAAAHHESHDIAVAVHIGIDYNCHALALAIHWVINEADHNSPSFMALFKSGADDCVKGESFVNNTCTARTCDSPRACPNTACHPIEPNATTGIAFKCGCDKGYELNGHTLRCEAVTCDAPTACRPYAKCVMLANDTINACNPTPSMPEQWRRGSKPCRRFECL